MGKWLEDNMIEKFDAHFYRRILDRLHANVYITDIETGKIVYMNRFMKETFHVENPEGEICWRILQKDAEGRCEFCKVNELLENPEEKECLWKEYNAVTGRTYLNYDILEQWGEKYYHIQYSTDITDNLQLSMDAAIDELTTLLNRKAGKKRLNDTLKSLKDEEQLVLALYDINGLKWVNDTFGHNEGDRLLHYVATKMQGEIYEPDFMFRLSGDEFIIVFMNTELYQADTWMRNVLQLLKKEREEAGIEYDVSFSYGLVKVRGKDHLSLSDALGLADTQMYIQKRDYHIEQGRNRLHNAGAEDRKKFEYNKDYIFEAFSETVEGYVFAGNLKTGEFMYSNRMVREFGLPKQVLTDAAAFWGELIHPEDRELFLKSNQEIADGKAERHTIFYRAKNASGKWVRLLCRGRMIRDQKGDPDLFAGVIRNLDQSEMRRNVFGSENSAFYYMNKTDEKERLMLETALLDFVNLNIPGGILATQDNEDWEIICFNQTLIEYMGYTHEEFKQKTRGRFADFICEEDRERVRTEIHMQLNERGIYETHYRFLKSDGSIAWVYDTGKYEMLENGQRCILSFLMDMPEEMERGQELQFINENSTSGVFKAYWGDSFEVTYANEGLYKIYGYSKKELEERFQQDHAFLVGKEEGERIQKLIRDTISTGEKQVTLEYQIFKKDGSVRWLHADCTITPQEDGRTIMMGIIMDITERHQLEQQLHHTEELYRFVRNYTNLDVWEYDATEHTIRIQGTGPEPEEQVYTEIPESTIRQGKIHPDSVEAFRRLHKRIDQGEDTAMAVIQFCEPDGTYSWQRITYISMKDEDVVKGAVGITENITLQKEAEIRAFKQEKMREMLAKDTIYSAHINLTKNRLEMVWSESGDFDIQALRNVTYQIVVEKILSRIANEDDRKRLQEEFTLEKMREYAKQNNFFREFEFRQSDSSGKIIWVSLSFRIIDSPTTGDKILFAYARNIDVVKRRELSFQKKAEIDEITGLYNLTTTKLLIENILNDRNQKIRESAFLLINIDNFRKVNQSGGFATGDELLRQIGNTIRDHVPSLSVAGRINGDTFAVYFRSNQTKKMVRKDIQELLNALCGSYVCGNKCYDITVSIGAICPNTRQVTYDFIYQSAYNALDVAKRSGGNNLIFHSEIAGNESNPEIFDRRIGEIFQKGFDWIQRGERKKEVYRIYLEYLGKCYHAEEVTLFQKKSGKEYERVVGWNAYKKGTTLEVNPENVYYFEELFRDIAPEISVYIDGKDSVGYEQVCKVFDVEELDYSIFIIGHMEQGELKYGIVVENCDARIRDYRVRDAVMEMIRWTKYIYSIKRECKTALENDRNTGVLNYESYMRRIEDFNEDMISTFGMIGVQMVDLKKYNQQYGTQKGDESLVYVADCMARIFGQKNCYRVGRTSFLAICENQAYEQFLEDYQKLEQELKAGYYAWVVTANVWEQATILPARMQEQLEEKLRVAQNKKKNSNATSEKAVKEILENIQDLIRDGSFCTFLQPKADTMTGQVCGAEALVRLWDKEKGLIPPGRFLPSIEQAGLIRHIDLFILKDVCRIMKSWMEEGWEPFPISLNYSRVTILEPDILEETNRIVESYGIPKNYIEIEITESIGSIDTISLKNIVDRFSNSGYRIALDDYGAEYSNVHILYSLQLNTLKLDRRIINDIYHDMKARVIVENVLDICKKFHIVSVAEGVETKEHLEVLKDMSCDMIQGYYLNKPLPEEEFHKYYIQ